MNFIKIIIFNMCESCIIIIIINIYLIYIITKKMDLLFKYACACAYMCARAFLCVCISFLIKLILLELMYNS